MAAKETSELGGDCTKHPELGHEILQQLVGVPRGDGHAGGSDDRGKADAVSRARSESEAPTHPYFVHLLGFQPHRFRVVPKRTFLFVVVAVRVLMRLATLYTTHISVHSIRSILNDRR